MGQSSPWGSAVSELGVAVAGVWSLGGTCRASPLPLSEKRGPAGSTHEWMEMLLVGRPAGRKTSIHWKPDFPVVPIHAGKSCLLCRGIQHAGNGCLHQSLYLPSSQFKIVLSIFCFPLICFVQFLLTQITRLSFSSIFQSSCAKA